MMLAEPLILFSAVTVFMASFIRTATGFGFALLAVPMLGLVMAPSSAVGISLVFQIISSLPIAFSGLSRAELNYSLKLVGFSLIGLLPGLCALLLLPQLFARFMLVASLMIALFIIARRHTFQGELSARHWAGLGLFAGFMQGVSGASGPPILAALHADTTVDIASKRRIMAVFFLFAGLLAVPPLMLNMPNELLSMSLFGSLFVAMAGGIAFGQWVFSRMNARHFHAATVVLLIISLLLAVYPLAHAWDN